jgi:hypothetical protein
MAPTVSAMKNIPASIDSLDRPQKIKGRGAASNPEGRFETRTQVSIDDGWERDPDEPARPATTVTEERARSIISRYDSPDIPFAQSINPYRVCENGCIYC